MSVATRSPLRVAGAVTNSGNINTGEQNFTLGGGQAATLYSGMASGTSLLAAPNAVGGTVAAGPDVLFFSGAGRFKDVVTHQSLQSGQAWVFYDSAVPTSGGPFPASGHKILGVIPASPPGGASGTFVAAGLYGFDVPFQSGLCARGLSGGTGITVTFTPEQSPVVG